MGTSDEPLTYAGSGVDTARGAALVERIRPAVASTRRPGADGTIGGFGGLFDLAAVGYRDPILVAANDGVGTKLKLAVETGRHGTVGIDLVAMCVNDLVVQGAEPLFFLDYLGAGRLAGDRDATIVEGIAGGCRMAGCALIGGETAELPGLYAGADYDLAGFAVGAAERGALLPRGVAEGDAVLGLASDGLHSNGFSLVRAVVERSGLALAAPAPFGDGTLGEALLAPTRIFVRPLLDALRAGAPIRALAHVTGGGLPENLPRALPDGLAAEVDLAALPLPPIMRWLRAAGPVADEEMVRTFNCGVGMVAIVPEAEAASVETALSSAGERVVRLGTIVARGDGAAFRTVGTLPA